MLNSVNKDKDKDNVTPVDENSEIKQETPSIVALETNKNKSINPPSELSSDEEEQKTSESLDSGVDNQTPRIRRSISTESIETNYSKPWDSDRAWKDWKRLFDDKPGIPDELPTPPIPKDDGDIESSEADSTTPLINSSKKTNRAWPRAKYAMQQKGFIIFGASAIILSTSAALIYLQDKAKFIAFFTNSPKYVTIPVIALATLLAISPIFCAIKQFRSTEKYQTQGKDADEILDKVLEQQPKDKVIKSVRLEYSNGTHSNFILNAWESKNDFINIDEKVISRTNKATSVINDRPLFTALLTGVVAANIAFPLGLLAVDGVNGVQKFYQNPLNHNVGLSLLIGSGVLALLIVCLGVHYYRKTNCTNLIYSQEKIDTQSINEKFIEEIKHQRTNVLEENHSKDAKRSSLTMTQVVVQSHNSPDVVYGVSG